MSRPEIATAVYLVWNLFNFVLMGVDKRRAKRDLWRIPERTLLCCAFLMGAVGSLLGSHVFHHKTRKTKFKIGLPAALLFNVAIASAAAYFYF